MVWVHGIGSRGPGDTLFPWTQPILEVFAEWRRQYDRDAEKKADKEYRARPDPVGENPVLAASVVDPENRWILVDVPKYRHRHQSEWLFTEAFWAADVRPPSFSAASSYLLKNLRPIISGITAGYGVRRGIVSERRHAVPAEIEKLADNDPRCAESELPRQLRWRLLDRLDAFWSIALVRWFLAVVGSTVATLALVIYATLHAIPIPAIQKRVEIAAADTFIVEWFADLAVILDDQAQGAAVRQRVKERVDWLKRHDCDDVVLLAHSGGTLVSFAALLQWAQTDLPVSKLITFGEAIKLGWTLEHDAGDWSRGNPIRDDGKLYRNHRNLRWVDIWASFDPAPQGPLKARKGWDFEIVRRLTPDPNPKEGFVQIESRPVTNFMLLSLDHGGYWANDEGFLVPVIRHIDDPRGNGEASRFFHSQLDRWLRIERRRRRVLLMVAWRWAAFVAAVASVVALIVGVPKATDVGNQVAAVWSLVPGGDIVSGVIDGIGNVVAVLLGAVGLVGFAQWLGSIGPALLGALVPILAVVAIFGLGSNSWYAHDGLERRQIRSEHLKPSGLGSARANAALVVGGLIEIILASAFGTWQPVAACYVVAFIVSIVLWLRGPIWDTQKEGDPATIARVAAMTRQM